MDRKNARSVVEGYIALALAGDVEKPAALAKNSPADPKHIAKIPKLLNVHTENKVTRWQCPCKFLVLDRTICQ